MWLESNGIQSPDHWKSLELVARRGAGGICTRNVGARLAVVVPEGLQRLLSRQPSLRRNGGEILRITASCLEDEDDEEVLGLEPEMYSGSDVAREKLRGMALTLRQLAGSNRSRLGGACRTEH